MNATYAALGLGALSFVGTFFVAPRFRDNFKEPLDWKEIYTGLVSKGGVRTVSAREAYDKTRRGAVLVDVRLADKYDKGHPQGAVNVPLYKPIQNWDIASNIRRAGFAFFGIFGTELNMDFAEDALAAVPKNKDLYVICEMGGTLQNKPGVNTGFQSRSLKAIYLLQQAGYNRLYHVKGGLIDWGTQGLPTESGSGNSSGGGSGTRGGSKTGGPTGAKASVKESALATVFGRR